LHMASTAMKIKGAKGAQKAKPKVASTLPASFYKNYVPPATPKINPQKGRMDHIPALEALPLAKPTKKAFAPSSLRDSKYPMSMPAHRGGLLMGAKVSPFQPDQSLSSSPQIVEEKETDSLIKETKKLKVGSITLLEMMSGPMKEVESSVDLKSTASATSQVASITSQDDDDDDVAPELSDNEEEDVMYDMDD